MKSTYLYRIFTEDTGPMGPTGPLGPRGPVGREIATELALKYVDAFTVFSGEGCWKGGREPSLIIEITDSEDLLTDARIRQLADDIKVALDQECVLVQKVLVAIELV
jgi:hypothetical protein